MTLRVVSWNCRRASGTHALWKHFARMSPDIAVLQEVSALPDDLGAEYDIRTATPPTRSGNKQRFHSALLVRGTIGEAIELRSSEDWVNRELAHFAPNFLAFKVNVDGYPSFVVIDVYAPAWPVERERLVGADVSRVKLTQNPDVWVADLLVAALAQRSTEIGEWIVGGDFNSCETFDSWRGGPRGNREWLDRMAALGFTECLRHSQGKLTPTFRKPGATEAHCQIDHLFVTKGLASQLLTCEVYEAETVYVAKLSDHLPIVASFSSGVRPHGV
jgi:exonuclease III